MIRITDVLKEIIQGCDLLQFGLAHRLLNLSKVADYLKPLVEARTKKKVTIPSILMSLSRLQKTYSRIMPQASDFKLNNLNVFTDLSTVTFNKTQKVSENTIQFFAHVKKKLGYINITESGHEITLIFDKKYIKELKKIVKVAPKYINQDVVGIAVIFDEKHYYQPGIIYMLFQQMTLQGINVIEISSTYTELVLYLERKDLKIAFDSLFNRFF
ncbi:MAG: hypothetical protein WC882_02095 [Candidatus Gracilibacteria bacterium]